MDIKFLFEDTYINNAPAQDCAATSGYTCGVDSWLLDHPS